MIGRRAFVAVALVVLISIVCYDVVDARVDEFDRELDGAQSKGIERILTVLIPLVLISAVAAWVRRRRQSAREANAQRERQQPYMSAYGRSPGAGYSPGRSLAARCHIVTTEWSYRR